jgi:hypothetical protein
VADGNPSTDLGLMNNIGSFLKPLKTWLFLGINQLRFYWADDDTMIWNTADIEVKQ